MNDVINYATFAGFIRDKVDMIERRYKRGSISLSQKEEILDLLDHLDQDIHYFIYQSK